MAEGATAEHDARFALAKFRPTTLPDTLVARPVLHDRLNAGAGQRLTVVVGSAGAGKSVLLSSWAAARPPGMTSWLSCDRADANPVRFWAGFIEATRMMAPWFGADAADLLAMDNTMSADITASIANDAAELPVGSSVVVDDFHTAAAAVAGDMTDLVERWPAGTAQLVLASRSDPPLRLHRLRMTGELCELRDRDLYFSLAESRDLLAGFGVEVSDGELALLHQRSEGWAAAVQMAALSLRGAADPVRIAQALEVPGVRALAWFEAGHLKRAADAAGAAYAQARRLGFDRHFFAVDYLRTLAGLALERRDLDTAEQLTEQALSIAERRRPMFEFLALLDRARIWAARGQVREALATIEAARQVLTRTGSVLLTWADELEALLRLSLGDPRTPAELASRLSPARRSLLCARIALASGDHRAAAEHLHSPSLGDPTPRRALVRQLLLAAAAIERGDPMAAGSVGSAVNTARQEGYLNTVVSTAPQVISYLIEHGTQASRDPFIEQLIGAGLAVRAAQPDASRSRSHLAEPLTPAELRILKLLPTSTYLQMAEVLYVSRNTIKTHLRSVYQKLGVESRSQAIERAIELRLL